MRCHCLFCGRGDDETPIFRPARGRDGICLGCAEAAVAALAPAEVIPIRRVSRFDPRRLDKFRQLEQEFLHGDDPPEAA